MFAGRTNWNLEANRLSEALARHRAAGKPLLDLMASNPTECGFAYNSGAILEALASPSALDYSPDARGLRSARESVAAYYAARGVKLPIDDIILTTSTSEAYSFAFRVLCNPNDEILIPEPSYPLFAFFADIQDVVLVRYPLVYDHGWQIDFHALEAAITARTRAVIVVHPNNPTGHFVKAREIEELNRICAARSLAIMADEVFLDFALGKNRFLVFLRTGVR
jgi:alanine-synthesizing transaminase